MCLHAKSVPSSHFYVSTCHKACQCFNLACQCAKRCATFSSWHANMPKSVPVFQTFLLRNAKGNSILYYYIKSSTLYLISYLYISCVCILHINFVILYFLKLFCSLDRNGNIKTLGFYTLQVTREYYDLLEL